MGAGILPVSIKNNKLFFLLGKENQYSDSGGWADFGGGSEYNETNFQTAVREGAEELNGFLGDEKKMKLLLKKNKIMNIKTGNKKYESFLMYVKYDDNLVTYFNNNYIFSHKHLPNVVRSHNGLLEKSEIKWFSINDLIKETNFRHYYKEIVESVLKNSPEIKRIVKNIKMNVYD